MKNIAVLASGEGTTFDWLLRLSTKGIVNFGITALLTNNSNAKCVDVAIKYNTQAIIVNPDNVWSLLPENTDLVVLAGWLKLLTIPSKWHNKVLNVHPSLLPKYGGKGMYGTRVHEAVIGSSDEKSGCTIHVVDNGYDTGEIIVQGTVPVRQYETVESLQENVQRLEKELYPKAIEGYLESLLFKS